VETTGDGIRRVTRRLAMEKTRYVETIVVLFSVANSIYLSCSFSLSFSLSLQRRIASQTISTTIEQ
jgi:hypothetical protein